MISSAVGALSSDPNGTHRLPCRTHVSASGKAYNALVLAQHEISYELGQRWIGNEKDKPINELPIFARERIKCAYETTNEKPNAGCKARPATEAQQATTTGPGDVAVI